MPAKKRRGAKRGKRSKRSNGSNRGGRGGNNGTMGRHRREKDRSTKIVLQTNDAHIPFQDRRALRLSLEVLKTLKPDILVTGSDLLDCYSISKYDTNPKRKVTLQKEINLAKAYLHLQRELAGPQSDIYYLEGNHERRLRKYLRSKARELASLDALSLDSLLGLGSLGIKWLPHGRKLRIGDVCFTHGHFVKKGGGNSARAHIERIGGSVSIGHSHRLARITYTQVSKTSHGFEGGCLCSMKQEYLNDIPDWQHGCIAFAFKDGRLVDSLLVDFNQRGFLKAVERFRETHRKL